LRLRKVRKRSFLVFNSQRLATMVSFESKAKSCGYRPVVFFQN
jgi:hypothetical protein